MGWSYERTEGDFLPIPEGMHRVRIEKAERVVSKTGRDMIKLTLAVSGYNSYLFHYIVFLPDRPEITNRNLTQLFDAFPGIQEGDVEQTNWVGKTGACKVKHEIYNGQVTAHVDRFVKPDNVKDLPAWKEPEGSSAPPQAPNGFTAAAAEDLPLW